MSKTGLNLVVDYQQYPLDKTNFQHVLAKQNTFRDFPDRLPFRIIAHGFPE
jgi:hypothetical protein